MIHGETVMVDTTTMKLVEDVQIIPMEIVLFSNYSFVRAPVPNRLFVKAVEHLPII